MKNFLNKTFVLLALVSTIGFTNCESAEENLPVELTIEEKVQLLESSEWLLKGFEDRVMHTFENGEKFTYYGIDSVFGEAIPGTQEYKIENGKFVVDFNFGNIVTYSEVKFSCDNRIVEFYRDGELNNTLYKRNSNYEECL